MDAFETRLRQRARTEPFSLPEQFVQQVQATCDALPEKAEKPHRRPLLFQVAAVLAILLVSFPISRRRRPARSAGPDFGQGGGGHHAPALSP